jgi:eukaryotic-like serine/threonine-protein kinase
VPQLDVIARALSRTRESSSGDSITSDDIRAFLQVRVAGFALLGAMLFGLFLVWRLVTILVETLVQDKPADWGSLAMGSEVLLFLAVWLLCRQRPRSLRFLRGLDLVGTVLACAFVLPLAFAPEDGPAGAGVLDEYAVLRPDYIILLVCTYVIIGRSIYVPSTARRTLALGLLIAPMLLGGLFVLHRRGHSPADYSALANPELQADATSWAIQWTIVAGVWWTASLLMATMTSRVFYGLRQEVRDARRLGQYTLLEELGAGGMGIVYRARHALLRRPTAVKLLPPDKVGEESIARFEREVQLTAMLAHPNTVRIFDYGRTADRIFYYAMELLEGASLDRVVQKSGPLPAGRVIHVLDQIAGALAEAHGVGLIHRDIKPVNLMLTRLGGVADLVKVLDFGLVKRIDPEAGALPAVTHAGSMAGTPHYMAPEAITSPDKVDARTDLYALGAVGYFLLTGLEVFKGQNAIEICGHHLHTEPLPPSQRVDRPPGAPAIPADLEALVLGCLAKAPSDRPASADELRGALRGCADAGAWTETDARGWWAEHGDAVASARPRQETPTAAATTLSIDLVRRDDPTLRERPRP